MNFLDDLKGIVQQQLRSFNVKFPSSASVNDLLHLTLNYELKTLRKNPRKVHTSPDFDSKRSSLSSLQQVAIKTIFAKFQNGDDINGHLSKESIDAKKTDKLLADWHIYHFHISDHKDHPSDPFFSRTGPVMFACVKDDAAYFIDIHDHGKAFPEVWTRQTLLTIIDANWPHILDPFRLKGISAISHIPTDLELKSFRKGNLNPVLQVGNSFIMTPGGGLSTDGTPTRNVMRADRTLHTVTSLQKWAEGQATQWKRIIHGTTGVAETELDFELVALQNPQGWGIREKKTQTMVYED